MSLRFNTFKNMLNMYNNVMYQNKGIKGYWNFFKKLGTKI